MGSNLSKLFIDSFNSIDTMVSPEKMYFRITVISGYYLKPTLEVTRVRNSSERNLVLKISVDVSWAKRVVRSSKGSEKNL